MSVAESHHLDLCYHHAWDGSLQPYMVVGYCNFWVFLNIICEFIFVSEIVIDTLQIMPAEVVDLYWTSLRIQGILNGICGWVLRPLSRYLEISPGPLSGQVISSFNLYDQWWTPGKSIFMLIKRSKPTIVNLLLRMFLLNLPIIFPPLRELYLIAYYYHMI